MSKITRQDTNGIKPLLDTGELGYDNYPAGGDVGRVYVGTGTENIALAKKNEDTTGNAATVTKLATARTINGVAFDGTANIVVSDSTAVNLTGNQTIEDVKTFSSSPIVPTPTTGTQAVNKDYADLKVALAQFTGTNQNLSVNGYQKLPGGLIIQWGKALSNDLGYVEWIYPIAFPTNFLICTVTTAVGAGAQRFTATLENTLATNTRGVASVWVGDYQSIIAGQVGVSYIAIGH